MTMETTFFFVGLASGLLVRELLKSRTEKKTIEQEKKKDENNKDQLSTFY